jgi:hypothetical protein
MILAMLNRGAALQPSDTSGLQPLTLAGNVVA